MVFMVEKKAIKFPFQLSFNWKKRPKKVHFIFAKKSLRICLRVEIYALNRIQANV